MKKFTFPLETLLKVKVEKENQAKYAVAEAQQVVIAFQQEVVATKQESSQVEIAMENAKKGTFSAADLAANLQYLDLLREKVIRLEDQIIIANNIVDQRRNELKMAMQERKAIDNLKEKQYEEWKQEVEKAESKFLDEQSTMRFARDNNG